MPMWKVVGQPPSHQLPPSSYRGACYGPPYRIYSCQSCIFVQLCVGSSTIDKDQLLSHIPPVLHEGVLRIFGTGMVDGIGHI